MANYSDAAIVRAVLRMRLHGQLIENVFFLRTKNAGIPDNEIAASVRTEIWNRLNDEVSSELTCEAITVQEIFPNAKDPFELAVNEAGVLPDEAAPTAVAAVVSMKTGLGGRSNRGRKYIAGLQRTNIDQSRIDAGRLASMQGTFDLMQAFFNAGNNLSNLTWGIFHRTKNGQPVPLSANSYTPVTSVNVQPFTGTMRSRLPGHGA
jgi:hypothetical protein